MRGEKARNKIKGRVGPALYSIMEPGDGIVAGVMADARSWPRLDMLAALPGLGVATGAWFDLLGPGVRTALGAVSFVSGVVPLVALIVRKPVFVAVTQREIICYRMSRLDHMPRHLLFRASPTSVRITGSGRRRPWSRVHYSGPGATKRGLRLSIVWFWRQDLHEVLTALQIAGAVVDVRTGVTALPLVPTSTGLSS